MLVGGAITMGSWGRKLYENDTALDVVDEIDSILADETDFDSARSRILSMLKSSYSDVDDQSIAWLTAAYRLVSRSGKLISELYKNMQESSGALPEETLQMLEKMIVEHGRKPRRKPSKKPESTWKIGEIYCYDVESAYADAPELKGYTIGFLCIDFYKYAGVHPIVYIFRSKSSMDEIRANPSVILGSEFWRNWKWGDNLFQYRAMLWANKADDVPLDRLHACGSINTLPEIADEFIICDIVSFPRISFDRIEEGLLRTGLMKVPDHNQ